MVEMGEQTIVLADHRPRRGLQDIRPQGRAPWPAAVAPPCSTIVKHIDESRFAQVDRSESLPMLATLAGGVLTVISVFLTWTMNGGKFSAYGRWSDVNLEGDLNGMHVRSAEPNYVSGVGAFMAMVAGALIVASTMRVLREYRRTKVYDSVVSLDPR